MLSGSSNNNKNKKNNSKNINKKSNNSNNINNESNNGNNVNNKTITTTIAATNTTNTGVIWTAMAHPRAVTPRLRVDGSPNHQTTGWSESGRHTYWFA